MEGGGGAVRAYKSFSKGRQFFGSMTDFLHVKKEKIERMSKMSTFVYGAMPKKYVGYRFF